MIYQLRKKFNDDLKVRLPPRAFFGSFIFNNLCLIVATIIAKKLHFVNNGYNNTKNNRGGNAGNLSKWCRQNESLGQIWEFFFEPFGDLPNFDSV